MRCFVFVFFFGRFLNTGASFRSLAFSFRMGNTTVKKTLCQKQWTSFGRNCSLSTCLFQRLNRSDQSPKKCGISGTFRIALARSMENMFEFDAQRILDQCFFNYKHFFQLFSKPLWALIINLLWLMLEVTGSRVTEERSKLPVYIKL